MTIKMDPKSFVVGAAVAVFMLVSMGIARKDQNIATGKDKADSLKGKLSAVEKRLFQKLTMPQPGRFQAESTEVYTVILDTATGQAWRYHLSTGRETELCPTKLEPAGD